jgi:DNA-directed RNA polymerase specialized sigma24 family protein
MSVSPDDVLALYDAHAPRLFALALRITGDERLAAGVIEEVFTSATVPAELADLVRLTREKSLTRYDRSAAVSVESPGMKPSSRQLVEDAFYGGMSVADLARVYSLPEETVKAMLTSGMRELRLEVAGRKNE